ncbi:MAG: hypothetical protein HY309_24515 [Pseudomonas fluorescens]|nr:hypothetical protein [Pseudomonas fluorescens]
MALGGFEELTGTR